MFLYCQCVPLLYIIILFSYFSRRRTTRNLWGSFFFIYNNIYVFFSSELCSAFPSALLSGICDIINMYFRFYVVSQSVIIRIYLFFLNSPTPAQSQDIAEMNSSRLPIPAVNLTLEHQIIYCQTLRKMERKGGVEIVYDFLFFHTNTHTHRQDLFIVFITIKSCYMNESQ